MSNTLRHIIYIIFSAVMGKLIGLATSFLVARSLQPADYGIWITLMLIPTYSAILCFGSVETLIKQYPYHIGRGEYALAEEVEHNVLGTVTLATVILIFIGICYELAGYYNTLLSFKAPAFPVILAAAVGLITAFYTNRFIARQNFHTVSVVEVLRSIIAFVFLVSFAWLWQFRGLVAGYVVSELVVCVIASIMSWKLYGKGGLNCNLEKMWLTVKIGFPISLFWWIFIVQTSLDRILSMALLGKTATGYYGLGVSIVAAIVLIPQAISRVLYPQINQMIGGAARKDELFQTVIFPAKILSLLLPIVIGIVVIVAPYVYQKLLSKYAPGLVSAQILFVGSFFRFCIGNGANFLIASNKQNVLLGYVVVSIIAGLSASLLLVMWHFNINGIALGTSISGAVLFYLVWNAVHAHMGCKRMEQWKETLALMSPFLVLLIVLGIGRTIISNYLDETGPRFIVHIVLFLAMYCCAIYINRPYRRIASSIYTSVVGKYGLNIGG